MLEVKNIYKYYNDFRALSQVSFRLGETGVVGLLGPNGAGKTTLMKILSGYFFPDEGEYLIDGKDVFENFNGLKDSIGYLPDVSPLYFDMTIKEYLSFVGELKNLSKKETRLSIDKISKQLKIDNRLEQLIGTLSKGYKQRVGIAMAVLKQSRMIILDEPMEGLDPIQVKEMRRFISDLGRKSLVILSSHVLSEIEENCTHILMLDKGCLTLDKEKKNILQHIGDDERVILDLEHSYSNIERLLKSLGLSELKIKYLSESRYILSGKKIYSKRNLILKHLIKNDVPVVGFIKKEMDLEELFE